MPSSLKIMSTVDTSTLAASRAPQRDGRIRPSRGAAAGARAGAVARPAQSVFLGPDARIAPREGTQLEGGARPHDIVIHPYATYAALAALVALTVLLSVWEWLTSLYVALGACWVVLAAGLVRTGLPDRLVRLDARRRLLAVALVALAMRWLPLLQGEVLTRDLEMMVRRGERYLDGETPFTEGFGVNKPPAYLYLASALVAAVGPDTLRLRALAGAADALVAVAVLVIGSRRASPRLGALAAMLYALNPVSVMSVGVSGHYDPYVVVLALGGLWLALGDRPVAGSLLLGAGFALKLYPIVLMPWLLLERRDWRTRVAMSAAFALPMAVSWAPVLAQNGDALTFYLGWQEAWFPNKSFSYSVANMLGWGLHSEGTARLSDAFQWLFLGLLGLMFLDWARRRRTAPVAHMRSWFKLVLVAYYALYGMMFVGSALDPKLEWAVDRHALAALVAVAYFPTAGAALWWLLRRHLADPSELASEDPVVFLGAMSVALLLFANFQYNPWYLLWLLPMVLLTRSDRARAAWAAMLPWNAEGLEITVLPGR